MARTSLSQYRRKRDLRRSPEPQARRTGKRRGKARFVIQQHDASTLHYDFRLEVDGVLVSWAVPKGLSTDPRQKRLGVRTEDHPLGYAGFEGVIPEGEYGAGAVLVWDAGTYRNLRADKDDGRNMAGSIDDGLVEVWLYGRKLEGGYALKRISGGKKAKWLLVKMKDDKADARRRPVKTQPESVKSGRSLAQIAGRQEGNE